MKLPQHQSNEASQLNFRERRQVPSRQNGSEMHLHFHHREPFSRFRIAVKSFAAGFAFLFQPVEREATFLRILLLSSGLLVAIVEWMLWQTGAALTPAAAATRQANDPTIIWAGQASQYVDFKINRLAMERPDIVILGDSPCSQLRSAMFKPYKAYNFCTTAWTIDQIRDAIVRIDRAAHPKIIIFSLGYYFFIDAWVEGWAKKIPMAHEISWSQAHFDGLQRLVQLFTDNPEPLARYMMGSTHENVDGMKLIGADAVAFKYGIRHDGSVLYPAQMRDTAPQHRANPFFGFLEAVPGSPRLQGAQLTALEKLGAVGKERGLTLIGIQFPLLKATVDYLDNNPTYNGGGAWREFESESTRQRFRDFGIRFFDASHDAVTADSLNFLDPLHPTERGTLGMLIHLLETPEFRSLLPDIDIGALRKKNEEAIAAGVTYDIYRSEF